MHSMTVASSRGWSGPLVRCSCALSLLASAGLAWPLQCTEVDAPEFGPVWALDVSPHLPGHLIAGVGGLQSFMDGGARPIATRIGGSADGGASWDSTVFMGTSGFSEPGAHWPQMVFDPVDPAAIWAVSHWQLYKSTNLGRTWSEHPPSDSVQRLAFDPLDPCRVYATGWNASAVFVFGSTDGGDTWSYLPAPFPNPTHDIAVLGVGAPGTVLLAHAGGIQRSTDGGASFSYTLTEQGAFRLAPVGTSNVVWSILLSPSSSFETESVARSLDGGRTWSQVATPPGEPQAIAAHPTDPDRAWVSTRSDGLFRTLDGGQSWIHSDGAFVAAQVTHIIPAPGNPDTLFAGGIGGQGGVWRSVDGGATWRPANNGLSSSVPELHFDGFGRAYALGLGLPVQQSGPDEPWRVLHYEDGPSGFATSLTVDRNSADTIVWTLGRFVIRSTDGGLSWSDSTPPGTGPNKPVQSVVFDSEGTLYAPAFGSRLHRSLDQGATWTKLDAPSLERIVPHPSDPAVLHATSFGKYFRSDDRAASWTIHDVGVGHWGDVEELAVSRPDPDRLAVLGKPQDLAGPRKLVFISSDGGSSWTEGGAGIPAWYLSSLDLDPHVPERVLVATGTHGVFLSVDGGASFAPWNDGIGHLNVRSVRFDPSTPGRAMASTVDGRVWVAALP